MKDKLFNNRSLNNRQGNTAGANVGYQINNTHVKTTALLTVIFV